MEHDCLTPAELPRLTRLYAAYLAAPKSLSAFYPQTPDFAGIKIALRELGKGVGQYPNEMRAAVTGILRAQNRAFAGGTLPEQAERNLSRLEAGAAAVVTGQQVGLFGGPAYTFYKAISALRIAAQLRERGLDAVPIFWMGGEDHDIAEVNHVYWPGSAWLERLEWAPAGGQPESKDRSVGKIRLGSEIASLVRKAVESLGGPASLDLGRILTAAYQPDQTFGSSFARMMSAIFAPHGLLLLDPIDNQLHALAAPLMRRAASTSAELTASLLQQNKRLENAGYHAQVKVTERSTLLFADIEGARLAVQRRNSGFAAGLKEWSAVQLAAQIDAHPELFSPNALLRPVVQDTLLPTVAYIGGPAEIAYFAQNAVLYKALLGRMPAILSRASFTIIEPQVARLLVKYSLTPARIFRGRQKLRMQMERQHLPKGLAARFTASETKIRKLLEGLRKPLVNIDATLVGALDTATRKMLYQFEKLRGKAGRAADFRSGVLDRHEQAILAALFPQHELQERTSSLVPFLARHGLKLLDTLSKDSGLGAAAHRIVRL
jgi:bacillithiol biosynthesis cysteine-adding enzyme BshC